MELSDPKVEMIVCVDKNWAIGKDGKLLFHIKEDLQKFKFITEWSNVIYGRKTLNTFPSKMGLPNRINIILTRDENMCVDPNIRVAHNIVEAFDHCNKDLHTFVIGGQNVYEQFLKYVSTIYVTKVNAEIEGANAFFPNLDKIPQFKLLKCEKSHNEEFDLVYTQNLYSYSSL